MEDHLGAVGRRELVEPLDIFCSGPTHRAMSLGSSGTGVLCTERNGLRLPQGLALEAQNNTRDPRTPNVKHILGVDPGTPAGQVTHMCIRSASTH